MEKKIKRKKRFAFLLAVLVFFSAAFGDFGEILPKEGLFSWAGARTAEAADGTTRIYLSKARRTFGISEIDRAGGEGLWDFTTSDGSTVFCLNSGKVLNNGDTVSYQTAYASTYVNQDIAKALTWYYTKSDKSGDNKGLLQAYLWACGMGKSKTTVVYQAGQNLRKSYTAAQAQSFCSAIAATEPDGLIWTYSVAGCVSQKALSRHQSLVGWTSGPLESPGYDTVTYSDSAEGSLSTTVTVEKRDSSTKALIDEAGFSLSLDGKKVATVTTSGGKASYTYERSYTVSDTSTKTYITNWLKLSASDRRQATASGYYQDKATALAAARAEVNASLETKKKAEQARDHIWTVTEISAPSDHLPAAAAVQKKTESGGSGKRTVSFSFYNDYVYGYIHISKINADTGSKTTRGVRTALNATYGVYAADTITGTDQRAVYSKGDLVATVRLDQDGEGETGALYLGSYYVQEISASTGMALSGQKYPVTLAKQSNQTAVNTSVTVEDDEYEAGLCIHKLAENEPEEGAVFQIINENNEVIMELTTDESGNASTEKEGKTIPYGTYTVHQTVGYDGYFFASDQVITIDEKNNNRIIELELVDEASYPSIELIKTATKEDDDAGVYEKKTEAGAVFVLLDSDGEQVGEELITDENGYARSGQIREPGSYTVHQVSGDKNYGLAEDFTVVVEEGYTGTYSYAIEDTYTGTKILIHKQMVDISGNKAGDEAGAEFYILDAAKVNPGEAGLKTEEERAAFVKGLEEAAILGNIITDRHGKAACLIDNDVMPAEGAVILQISGAKGYTLADPIYTSEYAYTESNGMKVYSFEIEDTFDNYAYLAIEKTEECGEKEYRPEEGAVFEIYDADGGLAETITTDASGYAQTGKLAFGLYTIHQVSGMEGHELAGDVDIVLSRENYHETYVYECMNPMGEIRFRLVKTSSETGSPVNWAVYEIRDSRGLAIATLTTGAEGIDGEAACTLPYGTYTLAEVKAADGYKLDTKEHTFVLNEDSLTMETEEDGTRQAYYTMEVTDEPIWGRISIDKTGNVLTGYYENGDDRSFIYNPENIAGAEYGLYARKAILDDAGGIVYEADALVSTGTTDAYGALTFTRTKKDGTVTEDMYMGEYYVRELSAPEGWLPDTEVYEITLTCDVKAHSLNRIESAREIPDTGYAADAGPEDTGKYTLISGPSLNALLTNATSVTFTSDAAPGNSTDVSADGDGSVVLWTSGTDVYISTQTPGQEVLFNMDSSYMFADCSGLTDIRFSNIDTEKVINMSHMFYRCTSLVTLDLSAFSTGNVTNMNAMFYGCIRLENIYVHNDEYRLDPIETEDEVKVRAIPNRTFCLEEELTAEDFTFSTVTNGVTEEEFSPGSNVTISPSAALTEGIMTVSFTFTGPYSSYGTVSAEITVADPASITVEEPRAEVIEYTLPVTDTIQTCEIRIKKSDDSGNCVEGAVFELRALVDIINQKGEVIVRKGDVIDTKISASDEFEYLAFTNLPTKRYAASDVPYMYEVAELSAPAGYTPSGETLKFSGNIEDNRTECFVYEKNVSNKANTVLTLTKVWENYGQEIPSSVQVEIQDYEGNVLDTAELSESNGWYAETKLPAKGEYRFVEKEIPEGYGVSYDYNSNCGAVILTNTSTAEDTELSVQKEWNDDDDADGLRLEEIQVDLRANGEVVRTISLSAKNDWRETVENLPVCDADGVAIQYEFCEREENNITGNSLTGYSIQYETDGTETRIINTHISGQTVERTVRKVWDDQDNKYGTRPAAVDIKLLADGKELRRITLDEGNSWTAVITGLPKFADGHEIVYTFEEVPDGEIVTGDPETGYVPSCEVTPDGTVTTITNSFEPAGPDGSIRITKKIKAEDLQFTDTEEIIFTFSLTGTDTAGNPVELSRDIRIKKADAADGMVSLGTDFTGLAPGKYTVSEKENPGYRLESISDVENGSISADGSAVMFTLSEKICSAQATFTNVSRYGSIRIRKYDSDGRTALGGVSFALKRPDGTLIGELVTDENGEAVFEDILPGSYVLTETATVSGHSLLAQPVDITIPFAISKEEARAQHVDTSKGVYSGEEEMWYFYDLAYEIANSAALKLPVTGGVTRYCPLIFGLLLLVMGCVWYKKNAKE